MKNEKQNHPCSYCGSTQEPIYPEYCKSTWTCVKCAATRGPSDLPRSGPDPLICGKCVVTEGEGGGYFYCNEPVADGKHLCVQHVFDESINDLADLFRPYDGTPRSDSLDHARAMPSSSLAELHDLLQHMLGVVAEAQKQQLVVT